MGTGVKALLEFRNLTLGYERHPAVHHLDGCIQDGALLAVVGPNGAGKSTLLKGIMGQLKPLQGDIHFHGLSPDDIAYLPQQAQLDRSFPISVCDFVTMGLWRQRSWWQSFKREDSQRIDAAMGAVGLGGFHERLIGSLSGGQLQRVLFARLLLQDARLILLDEPFAAIDTKTAQDLMQLVQRWHGDKKTVIAVLHDLDQVRMNFPEALLLAREPVALGPTAKVLSAENLLRARRLNEAFMESAPLCRYPGSAA
jgi:zinc/manganese transport system ATP-binding protein